MAARLVRARRYASSQRGNATQGSYAVMSRATARCATLSFLAFLSAGPVTHAAWQVPSAAQNIYIVVLRDSPVATRAAEGRSFNRNAPDMARRVGQLTARHASMLSAIGGARKLYSYTYALNGFAAELSRTQVAKLRADPSVRYVTSNEIRRLDTLTVPAFLGLNGPNAAWDLVGGGEHAGDNVIVGVIDT